MTDTAPVEPKVLPPPREPAAPWLEWLAAGAAPRRVCPWHLVDLGEDAEGEVVCRVGRRHHPRAWLDVDRAGRILAAGRACGVEPDAVILDPPMPLREYVAEVWLKLCWPRRMFGGRVQEFRIPVAARRAIVARRKSVRNRDTEQGASAA